MGRNAAIDLDWRKDGLSAVRRSFGRLKRQISAPTSAATFQTPSEPVENQLSKSRSAQQ